MKANSQKIHLSLVVFVLTFFTMNAQTKTEEKKTEEEKTEEREFVISANIRPRFEYRHGYNNLIPNDTDPAAFVAQRSRLNIGYKQNYLRIFLSVQDVSTWGDTRQISLNDGNDSFHVFQAWTALSFNKHWDVKLGRQVIAYDDQRIFGGLNWATQGRFHDAALLRYKKEKSLKADLGFALSQQGEPKEGNLYAVQGFFSYKSMQYLHVKKMYGKRSVSLLFLNNEFQKIANGAPIKGSYFRQTAGIYFKAPVKKFSFSGSAYYQFGNATATQKLSAYQFSLEAIHKLEKLKYGVGVEMLSGTDATATDDVNRSFFPLYGTNHKFNGFMDYFYVGNHANNVGLNDVYAKFIIPTGKGSNMLVKGHYFGSNAKLAGDKSSYLGTEIDLVYTRQFSKNVNFKIGYSHMFASESMSVVKGGRPNDNTNNWAWVQVNITPQLFKTNFKKN